MADGGKYPWKRFWCPREGSLNLSDEGFLVDPESRYGKALAPDVVPFDKIASLPCLALLGEPGIGKSTAMEDLREAIQASVVASGDRLLYVDLRGYGEEDRLIHDIFECSIFQDWLNGACLLHLLLDSLDECRLLVPQVAAMLARRLGRINDHLPRLRLRIACRTADWPASLEGALPALWGKDGFGAYELAPLLRKDIQAAAEAEDVEFAGFLGELRRTESVPLAIKPIMLRFLLSVFKTQGRFPTSRRELYELGCLKLCEEVNLYRQDLRLHAGIGRLSAQERMAVASRIAAITVFCRKSTVITGALPAQNSDDEALVAAFTGGSEPVATGQVDVSDSAVREVLGTGLFSSRGPDRMGFAHQTYAEFLASRYLVAHGVPTDRVLRLLRHPDDEAGHVVPQLHEAAAWIAGTDPDVLRAVAQVDPQILLRGDLATLTEADRRLVVDAMLLALDQRRANDRDWGLWRHYRKLMHPGLAEQLRGWIVDKSRHCRTRDTAIDLARACECRELQTLLANMALDQTEEHNLRAAAARSVAQIGDADTRQRLLPLATGKGGDDPEDQLKGCALSALWPGQIPAQTMFEHLTPPQHANFHGAYMGFLTGDLTTHLSPEHLPHALRWLNGLAGRQHLDVFLRRVSDAIVLKGWGNMHDPETLGALATLCARRFREYHGLIDDSEVLKENSQLFDDPAARRTLAARVIEVPQDRTVLFELMSRSPRLVRADDFEWCAGQLRNCVGLPIEEAWAKLVWHLFSLGEVDARRLDLLIDARRCSPILRGESDLFFTPVELDSERARKMKRDQELVRDHQVERSAATLDPSPRQRVQHWLERSESGDHDAWWVLLGEMTLEDTSTHYRPVGVDVCKLPGWQNADPPTRQRILAAADRSLRNTPVDPLKWLREPHQWRTSDTAPYAAFLLLKNEAPPLYDALPAWVWKRHVATVLCFPTFGEEDGPESLHQEVALRCYQQAKEAVLLYLPIQIDAEDRYEANRHISCDGKLGQCWDDDLKRGLHEKLIEAQAYWQKGTFDKIAALLLAQGHTPVRDLLVALVRSVTGGHCGDFERARLAASGLIARTSDAAWPTVWPAVLANRQFGRDLLMSVARGLYHNAAQLASKLTEGQLGELYVWLVNEFPFSQDRRYDGAYTPDGEDSARDLRDGVLRFLENQGTPASVLAIQRASEALTDLDWLSSAVIEARKNTLRRTWRPSTPEEFRQIATDPTVRQVRNARELQELLVEVIGTLEQDLQGETPAAADLWDQTCRTRGKERYRPKDENHLSDWIKRHLESRRQGMGIVVAREVEIRAGEGSGKGEISDIHVTAVVPGLSPGQAENVRVIIETKGCWHKELKVAMQTQLTERYLKDNQCQHGIYLVGWYACPQWDDKDARRNATPRWSLDAARAFFQKQAQEFSRGGLSLQPVVLNTALRGATEPGAEGSAG